MVEANTLKKSEEKGRAEGEVIGIEKGEYLAKVAIAKTLIGKRMTIDEIADTTGIPSAELAALTPS